MANSANQSIAESMLDPLDQQVLEKVEVELQIGKFSCFDWCYYMKAYNHSFDENELLGVVEVNMICMTFILCVCNSSS